MARYVPGFIHLGQHMVVYVELHYYRIALRFDVDQLPEGIVLVPELLVQGDGIISLQQVAQVLLQRVYALLGHEVCRNAAALGPSQGLRASGGGRRQGKFKIMIFAWRQLFPSLPRIPPPSLPRRHLMQRRRLPVLQVRA